MILYNNLRFFNKNGDDINSQLIQDINVTLSVESADGLGFNATLSPIVKENNTLSYIDVIHGGNGFSNGVNIIIRIYDNVNETETTLSTDANDISVGVTDGAIVSVGVLIPPTGITYPAQQTMASIPMGNVSTHLIESEEIRILEEVAVYNTLTTETTIGYVYPTGGENDKLVILWNDDEKSDEEEFNLFSINKDEEFGWIVKNKTQVFEFTNNPTIVQLNGRNYKQVLYGSQDTNVMHINIMFMSKDVGVFERPLSLNIDHIDSDVKIQLSQLTFNAETEEVDERFGNLLQNFGRDFPNEKEFLLRDSDVFEPLTDNKLLNQKKKELLVEGNNIYPYVGSYKALINFLNWAGYDDLKIKEYWQNLDETSENYMKFKHQDIPFDILQEGGKPTYETLPSKKFKKTNLFGLYYNINQVTGNVDQYGIPITEDTFMFSIEEVLIKLFGLKQYLKHNFLPLNARIIDITGEGIYFERYSLNAWTDGTAITNVDAVRETDFTIIPENPFIIDLRPLGNYDYGTPTNINPYPVIEDNAVRCIAANKEYMSSPAGSYFGSTISGLDIEIDYSDLDLSQSNIYAIFQGHTNAFSTFIFSLRPSNNDIRIAISTDIAGLQQTFIYPFPSTIPIEGNIKIKGNGNNLEVYFNDILVLDELVTMNQNISEFYSYPMYFAAVSNGTAFPLSGITYSYIKIGIHEWKSPDWTAPTTTNSQGVITTLHSDVSTAAMIITTGSNATIWNTVANNVIGYYDDINNVKHFADEPDAPIGAPIVLSMTLFDIVWNDLNSTPWDYYNADGAALTPNIDFGTGTLTSITIDNAGAGYLSDPVLTIQGGLDGGGTAATAHTELSAGGVVNVIIDTPGSGYISQPSIVVTGGFPTSLLNTWDTFGVGEYYELEWRVQGDDGVFKYSQRGRIDAMFQHAIILPYIGTYTVEMILYDTDNNNYNLFKKSAITVHSYEAEYCAYTAGGKIVKTWADQDWTWDEAENFGYTWINPILNTGTWDDMQISWDELEAVDNHGINSVYPNTVDTNLIDISERDILAGNILEVESGNIITVEQESYLTFDSANNDIISFGSGHRWINDQDNFEIQAVVSNVTTATNGVIIGKATDNEDGWSLYFDFASQKLIFISSLANAVEVPYTDIPFSDPILNILVRRVGINMQIYINDILKVNINGPVGPYTEFNTSIPFIIAGRKLSNGGALTNLFSGFIYNARINNINIPINEKSGPNIYATNHKIGTILTDDPLGYTYINNTMWVTTPAIVQEGITIEVSFPQFQPILKAGEYVYFRKSGQIQRTQLLVDSTVKDNLTKGNIKVDSVNISIDKSWEFLSSIGSTIITEIYDKTLVDFKPGDFITFKKPDNAYTVSHLSVINPIYNVLDTNDTPNHTTPIVLSALSLTDDYTNFKIGERCGVYQFNTVLDVDYTIDPALKTITIVGPDSIIDHFIPGFSTIELYSKNGLIVEYKQTLLVFKVEETGVGPYTTVITVKEVDGSLSEYFDYAESYLDYKYNSFQTEIISTMFDGTDTIINMNINEYPASELFAPQFYDSTFTLATNWFFDYSISNSEYSLEIDAIGTEGGYPYIKLLDIDSELYMTSTSFIIDTNVFNVDRANKHIGTDITWDKLNDLKWDEAEDITWDQLIFNNAVMCGFIITDVGISGTIQFNVEDPFIFETITGAMSLLERLTSAAAELTSRAEGGLAGFVYFVGNNETYLQAVAKDLSANNLGTLSFTDGVTGEWLQDTSKSHTYPVNNYLNESWQTGFFGGNNAEPDWNFLYQIYTEYGIDPIGNPGWYPAANIPAEYYTEGFDWYAAGIPYHKPVSGSLTFNDLSISKSELIVNNYSTVFINANRSTIPGKIKYIIELYKEDGELLVKTISPLLIWLFTERGNYDIKLTVWDNNLNKIESTRQNAIIVK